MKKIVLLLISTMVIVGCNQDQPEQFIKQKKPIEEASAAHILITHSESKTNFPCSNRSRTEAKDLSLRIAVFCNAAGGDFSELAKKYSEDSSTKNHGGYLGIFGKEEMLLPFEVETFEMGVGDIRGGIETELGFHVIKRLPVKRALVSHILVAWNGSQIANKSVKRTQAQALLIAQKLSDELSSSPNVFCDLVSKHSDDSSTRFECGFVGLVEPGTQHPAIENELFRMKPNSISDIIETELGYHIIRRES